MYYCINWMFVLFQNIYNIYFFCILLIKNLNWWLIFIIFIKCNIYYEKKKNLYFILFGTKRNYLRLKSFYKVNFYFAQKKSFSNKKPIDLINYNIWSNIFLKILIQSYQKNEHKYLNNLNLNWLSNILYICKFLL